MSWCGQHSRLDALKLPEILEPLLYLQTDGLVISTRQTTPKSRSWLCLRMDDISSAVKLGATILQLVSLGDLIIPNSQVWFLGHTDWEQSYHVQRKCKTTLAATGWTVYHGPSQACIQWLLSSAFLISGPDDTGLKSRKHCNPLIEWTWGEVHPSRAGAMAQQLRALSDLPEVLSSIPSTT